MGGNRPGLGARPAQFGAGDPARALGEDTLRRARRVLGPDHLIVLWTASALTHALVQLGEVEPARALGEDTLQRCRRVLATEHPIAQYLMQAASIKQLLGDDAAAARPDPQP